LKTKNPQKNVPKAIYYSIGIVGNLPIKTLIAAQDNALAIAAKPSLGTFGFILISVGALFSISSALNATLYVGANIVYSLAKEGELPEVFERKVWFKSTEGLYITTALGIIFTLCDY
jgi:amino acid transporter